MLSSLPPVSQIHNFPRPEGKAHCGAVHLRRHLMLIGQSSKHSMTGLGTGMVANRNPSKYTKREFSSTPQWAPSMKPCNVHVTLCKSPGPTNTRCLPESQAARPALGRATTQQPLHQQQQAQDDGKGESNQKSDTHELWSEPTSLWEDSCLTVGVTMAGWGMPVVCRV